MAPEVELVYASKLDLRLPKQIAVETVATPIVLLVVCMDAFREKAVAKGAGG